MMKNNQIMKNNGLAKVMIKEIVKFSAKSSNGIVYRNFEKKNFVYRRKAKVI
jgi:hypothetical protein